MTAENLELINKQGVSIIIGARNEFPQIAMTVCNLMEDCVASGITKYEVIIMDNGSTDETSRFFAWKVTDKTTRPNWFNYEYSPRGMVYEGKLRIFYDPIMSNVGTRNKGVLKARYENIIFSDAHIIVRPGTVLSIVDTLVQNKGIVHAPISWMGSSSENPQPGYQYSYKVGEKIWGTWNRIKVADKPFFIPLCGHAFLAVKKDEFLQTRGYPLAQRVYGGGEPYLDTKYWMLGKTSMMDPNALVYHLSAGRGYNWHSNDLIFNMFLVSYIMGGRKWADRIKMTYYNKPSVQKEILDYLFEEALKQGEEDYQWLNREKLRTFEEVLGLDKEDQISKLNEEELTSFKSLDTEWYCQRCTKRGYKEPHVMRPWDYLNDEKFGHHRSYVHEFKLTKRDNRYFIGETEITDPLAMELASQYI